MKFITIYFDNAEILFMKVTLKQHVFLPTSYNHFIHSGNIDSWSYGDKVHFERTFGISLSFELLTHETIKVLE